MPLSNNQELNLYKVNNNTETLIDVFYGLDAIVSYVKYLKSTFKPSEIEASVPSELKLKDSIFKQINNMLIQIQSQYLPILSPDQGSIFFTGNDLVMQL